jgi:hypothetical protein
LELSFCKLDSCMHKEISKEIDYLKNRLSSL